MNLPNMNAFGSYSSKYRGKLDTAPKDIKLKVYNNLIEHTA